MQPIGRSTHAPFSNGIDCREDRIKELESQLATATESGASLTRPNAEPTARLADVIPAVKKLKRFARRDESSFEEQLAVAQNRRG